MPAGGGYFESWLHSLLELQYIISPHGDLGAVACAWSGMYLQTAIKLRVMHLSFLGSDQGEDCCAEQ